MDKETILNNLFANYGKYGVTKADLINMIEKGMNNYDLSLEAIYSGLRMSLASAFNEHELFTMADVMAITGETEEELAKRIEQYRVELLAAGENPDDYFKPIKPTKSTIYYFPYGLS